MGASAIIPASWRSIVVVAADGAGVGIGVGVGVGTRMDGRCAGRG